MLTRRCAAAMVAAPKEYRWPTEGASCPRGRLGLLLVHGFLALTFVVSMGCSLPYVYPRISSIDSVDLVRLSSETHAFRIDADGWINKSDVEMKEYRLSLIPLDGEGRVPAQTNLNLEYGLFGIGSESSSVATTHWTKIRLYRRGYQMIELSEDRKEARVEWKPAVGVLAQEKAVDDLLWPPADVRVPDSRKREKDKLWPGSLVGPGSLSSRHREALLFIAGEYERLILVWGAKADAATKVRLEQKARDSRERAGR